MSDIKFLIIKILVFLRAPSETKPVAYGTFHFIWAIILALFLIIVIYNRKKHSEKKLKTILLIFSITSILFEIVKQLVVGFNIEPLIGVFYWSYNWSSFPFQFCSVPMYICLICAFLKKGKVRDFLLSYMVFFSIWGSIGTLVFPASFSYIPLVNYHTMYLHCGSLLISVYLIATKEIKNNFNNVLSGYIVFLFLVLIAQLLNIAVYNFGLLENSLNSPFMNLFAISPYYVVQYSAFLFFYNHLPYYAYILFYLLLLFMGGCLVYYTVCYLEKKSIKKQ